MPDPVSRLHPRLLADCHLLGACDGHLLLLHRNASVCWLILVPATELTELFALPTALRDEVLDLAGRLAVFLQTTLGYPKVNFAAIGNVVPQLHLHLVGRRPDDPLWPLPVWGHDLPACTYSQADCAALIAGLTAHAGLRPV